MGENRTSSAIATTAGQFTSWLPGTGSVPARSPRLREETVDLHVGTVDVQGRVRMAKVAAPLGWRDDSPLVLAVYDGVLRLVEAAQVGGRQHVGIPVSLDARLRLQLPFGIKTVLGLRPGARLILLGIRPEGTVVGFPVTRLVERLVATGL